MRPPKRGISLQQSLFWAMHASVYWFPMREGVVMVTSSGVFSLLEGADGDGKFFKAWLL